MIELIKFEFKKIISKRIVVAFGILVFLLSIVYNGFYQNQDHSKVLAEKYEKAQYTEEEITDLYVKATERAKKGHITEDDAFLLGEVAPYYPESEKVTFQIFNNKFDNNEIKEYMKELENKNKKDTYEYRAYAKAEELTSNLGEYRYKFLGSWRDITENSDISSVLILVMLILGLSSVFSYDYSCNIAQVVLSTKKGKGKIITARIIASLCYAILVFISINGLFFLNGALSGIEYLKLPLSSLFAATPYNLTIGNQYVIGIMISFFGVLSLTLLIILLSLLLKNNISVFAITLLLYFSPVILNQLEKNASGIMGVLISVNIKGMFEWGYIFKKFKFYNFFGNPVLRPELLIALGIAIIVSSYIGIKVLGKKQVIA